MHLYIADHLVRHFRDWMYWVRFAARRVLEDPLWAAITYVLFHQVEM